MAKGIRVRAECDQHPDAKIRYIGFYVTARQKYARHDDGSITKYIDGEFILRFQCPICQLQFMLTVDNLDDRTL